MRPIYRLRICRKRHVDTPKIFVYWKRRKVGVISVGRLFGPIFCCAYNSPVKSDVVLPGFEIFRRLEALGLLRRNTLYLSPNRRGFPVYSHEQQYSRHKGDEAST